MIVMIYRLEGASLDRLELGRKAVILKQYELYCYKICYHMLQCDAKAWQAAVASIEHLFHDAAFFGKEDKDRQEIVRKTSIRYSLNYFISKNA